MARGIQPVHPSFGLAIKGGFALARCKQIVKPRSGETGASGDAKVSFRSTARLTRRLSPGMNREIFNISSRPASAVPFFLTLLIPPPESRAEFRILRCIFTFPRLSRSVTSRVESIPADVQKRRTSRIIRMYVKTRTSEAGATPCARNILVDTRNIHEIIIRTLSARHAYYSYARTRRHVERILVIPELA